MPRTRSWKFPVAVVRYIADIMCHDETTWSWKSFAPARLQFHRRKSVPAPKNVIFNTVSDDPRFSIFYLQLKERKISRTSLFVRHRWSYRVVTFSLLSSGVIVACTIQLRFSRYSRLPFVLGILYTIQRSGSFPVGLKFEITLARFISLPLQSKVWISMQNNCE